MRPGERENFSFLRFTTQCIRTGLLIGAALFLGTCGLEEYIYIYPIPQANIVPEGDTRAVVSVPSDNTTPPFSHFRIFYRIYISDQLGGTTTTNYSSINPVLYSDYNAIEPYIDSETLINTNMDDFFQRRGYKRLSFLNALNIEVSADDVLDSAVLGRELVFDFPSLEGNPTMTVNNTSYTLQRSNAGFSPAPDHRYFLNNADIRHIDREQHINDDVVDKDTNAPKNYTYAALFIAAVGMDNNTYSYVYSTPSLIHVFQLPDR